MAELIGRFHPLIVHLPIGIIVLAFLMEIVSRAKKYAYLKTTLPFVLQVGIAAAFLSLFTGWIMPKEGDFDELLLSRHFWSSLSTTIGLVLVYVFHQTKNERLQKGYFPMFLVTISMLGIAGHFGGSLTHGANHLTAPIAKKEAVKVSDVNQLSIYTDIVAPIFQKKCNGCHNAGKQKGGLIMSTPEGLQKGGDGGKVILVGDVANSVLVQRLHLPLEEEEHMPPEGKAQLNKNEIQLLEWWIKEGASFDQKVGQVQQSEAIETILKGYQKNEQAIDVEHLPILGPQQLAQLNASGINVIPLSQDHPLVFVQLSRDTLLSRKQFKQLNSIAEHITELDLSFSSMNDQLMAQLTSFKHLTSLKLQGTTITSKGLKYLSQLKYLQSLNLYGTKVDDEAFTSLQQLEGLANLYLWQTQVSDQKVEAFSAKHPLVKIHHEIDQQLFGDARLRPPTIIADQDLFEDTLRINMSLNFKDVDIFYTLDGSEPDSLSQKYQQAFLIDQSAIVKAISVKKGWTTSEAKEKIFIKAGYKVQNIRLSKNPNVKYKAKGAKSLIDFEKGSESFTDGKWLGYEGEHVTVNLDLGKAQTIRNVVVGSLEDTRSYIFHPKAISIATSLNGRTYQEQSQIDIPVAEAGHPAEAKSFLLSLPNTSTRYVQVKIFGTLKNPEWHAAPGAKNWVFLDEIVIN